MPEVDTQLTQDDAVVNSDEQVTDSQDDSATTDDSNANRYFLEVDDRTKYKTAEDAIKGYQNAGQRIAELSAWEREIADVYDVRDPKQIAAILDEYIQIKEAAAQAEAAAKGKTATATHTDEGQLPPKEQAAFEWLKKVAPKLGYVSAEEVKALKDEIASLRGGFGNFEQQQEVAKVQAGRNQIQHLLKDAKLPESSEFSSFVEDSMTAYIGGDKGRLATWRRGGPAVEALLKEAFEHVKKHLSMLNIQKAAGYQSSKQSGSNKVSVKRLPEQGTSLKRGAPSKQAQGNTRPSQADIHNAAWALAQKRWGGETNDSGE